MAYRTLEEEIKFKLTLVKTHYSSIETLKADIIELQRNSPHFMLGRSV